MEPLDLPPTPTSATYFRPSITVDFDALTQRDKLELAAELIHTVLQET